MRKLITNKWFILFVGILVFVLLDMQNANVTLEDRAIIIGLGIDMDNSDYVVTAELLAPSNGGAQDYQKKTLVYTEKGRTVDEALEAIDKSTGQRISLKHCSLILLGEETLRRGKYEPLVDFFTGNTLYDNTSLAAVEGTARSVLESSPPLYSVISYEIERIFKKPHTINGAISATIKDFFVMYTSYGGAIRMPVVTLKKNGAIGSDQDGKKEQADAIEISKAAILDKSGIKLVLNAQETEGLSYITENINIGNVLVDGTSAEQYEASIISVTVKKIYDIEQDTAGFDVKIVARKNQDKTDDINEVNNGISKAQQDAFLEKIEKSIYECYETCKEEGLDVFDLGGTMYSAYGKKFEAKYGEDYLGRLKFDLKTTAYFK